jgi:Flp pilus assembly protein TadG
MTSLLNLLLRLLCCTSGAAALEGALVMPVAISLMAGGVEFSRAYSASSTADKSLRDAARYLARVCDHGATGGCITGAAAVCGWGLTKAKNLAVYGNIGGTGNPLIAGWSTSNVTLVQPSSCSTLPTIIQLRASVPFTSVMLSAIGLSNTITMHVQHEERWIGE